MADSQELSCPRCGDIVESKGHLIIHLRSKIVCEPNMRDIPRENILKQPETFNLNRTVECKFCTKRFSYKNFSRHSKLCKKQPTQALEPTTGTELSEDTNAVVGIYTHGKSTIDEMEKPTHPTTSKLKSRVKSKIPQSVRMRSWDMHIGVDVGRTKCLCCQQNQILQGAFVCGHVVPESLGGPTIPENLRPICGPCNASMHNKNMVEFAKKYHNVVIETVVPSDVCLEEHLEGGAKQDDNNEDDENDESVLNDSEPSNHVHISMDEFVRMMKKLDQIDVISEKVERIERLINMRSQSDI